MKKGSKIGTTGGCREEWLLPNSIIARQRSSTAKASGRSVLFPESSGGEVGADVTLETLHGEVISDRPRVCLFNPLAVVLSSDRDCLKY